MPQGPDASISQEDERQDWLAEEPRQLVLVKNRQRQSFAALDHFESPLSVHDFADPRR